tara:strand:+ start:1267 stop:2538 length:1272 start_codon:yes stop_codon:yes gene_type:complete
LRKKVVVRGPVLTRSGYGEHARFVCRALRAKENIFDVFIVPINWGQCGWITEDNEERAWLDEKIKETAIHAQNGGQFDMSVQITIPNEWDRMAPINIGVTAGIETTKVAPVWLEKANMMDKIIVVSDHSKQSFENAIFEGMNSQTQQPMTLKCETPIDVVHYPVKTYENLPEVELGLNYDFNYLVVAQHGPRKNLENTIRWFVEENIDQKVGLVVKTFIATNSVQDRMHTEDMLSGMLLKYPDRKCKVYLLHGDMSDEEIHSLYTHPKIKCVVSATHGEGFGLPLFEAAYNGLPVIAPGWSGQCDFLYAPFKSKKGKGKSKDKHPYFAEVDYTIGPIPPSAHWEGVIIKESMWCYPEEGSYKMNLRAVRKNYSKWKKKADTLQKWILENFESSAIHERMANCIFKPSAEELEWMQKLSKIEIL